MLKHSLKIIHFKSKEKLFDKVHLKLSRILKRDSKLKFIHTSNTAYFCA